MCMDKGSFFIFKVMLLKYESFSMQGKGFKRILTQEMKSSSSLAAVRDRVHIMVIDR